MAGNPFDQKKTAAVTKARAAESDISNAGDEVPTETNGGDPFARPTGGGGDGYKFVDFLGELVMVKPIEVGTMVTKISPETEFVRVDCVRLDNENEYCEDLLVFGSALIRVFKTVLRGPRSWTVGRLQMGEAKNGRNAPYILSEATKEELVAAQEVYNEMGLG